MKFNVQVDGDNVTLALPNEDELNKFSQALRISGIDVKPVSSKSASDERTITAHGDWRDIFRAASLASREEPLPPDQT